MSPLTRLTERVAGGLAFAVVACSYASTLAVCRVLRRRRPRAWTPTGRIAVCGTFHNPNWFRSHAAPLGRSGMGEVIMVTDRPQPPVERVSVRCPPRWLPLVLGRTLAKLTCMLALARRLEPDLYMGYHIIPNSLIALLAGRLFGRPTCYQMTGGPAEVAGGGFLNDNAVLTRLRRPSRFLERLALAVVREFDLVVVRGASAQRFLADRGVGRLAAITGSVDPSRFSPCPQRPYDLLFVGQIIERKRPLEFLEITAALARLLPSLRAAMVGDGPLRGEVERRVVELGLDGTVELCGQRADVERFLTGARVFLLPSRSEGLSIAMAEAMMAGAVPVVADVGDLSDLVRTGVNGYLVDPDDRQAFVRVTSELLRDRTLWARLSEAAREAARAHNGLDHVSELWFQHLDATVRSYGGAARVDLDAAGS